MVSINQPDLIVFFHLYHESAGHTLCLHDLHMNDNLSIRSINLVDRLSFFFPVFIHYCILCAVQHIRHHEAFEGRDRVNLFLLTIVFCIYDHDIGNS